MFMGLLYLSLIGLVLILLCGFGIWFCGFVFRLICFVFFGCLFVLDLFCCSLCLGWFRFVICFGFGVLSAYLII